MRAPILLAFALLTIGAAPHQEEPPHCHIPGPFVVAFGRGSAALDPRAREVLNFTRQIATVDRCWRKTKILVSGHADAGERRGTSRARAKAVRDYLVAGGVAAKLVVVEFGGPLNPGRPSSTDAPRREDQRAIIFFGLP